MKYKQMLSIEKYGWPAEILMVTSEKPITKTKVKNFLKKNDDFFDFNEETDFFYLYPCLGEEQTIIL